MNTKKILKITGKTLASIVCPPVGFATWPKKNKFMGVVAGAFFSGISSTGIIYSLSEKIYNSPSLVVKGVIINDHPLRTVGEMFVSPIAFYLDNPEQTCLFNGNDSLYVYGNDVIKFDGKVFNLNLGPERNFVYKGTKYSVVDAEKKVADYESSLQRFLDNGNIIMAREIKEKLDKEMLNLQNAQSNYTLVRQKFQNAVDKMNSELDSLSGVSQR